MEIKVNELMNYINLPVCHVHTFRALPEKKEQWYIVEEVNYQSDFVEITFAGGETISVRRDTTCDAKKNIELLVCMIPVRNSKREVLESHTVSY